MSHSFEAAWTADVQLRGHNKDDKGHNSPYHHYHPNPTGDNHNISQVSEWLWNNVAKKTEPLIAWKYHITFANLTFKLPTVITGDHLETIQKDRLRIRMLDTLLWVKDWACASRLSREHTGKKGARCLCFPSQAVSTRRRWKRKYLRTNTEIWKLYS